MSPVKQLPPALVLYTLAETLPWSVSCVDAVLEHTFGVYRYRLYEIRGGFHLRSNEYLVELLPSLAAASTLPGRFKLEIVGQGPGSGGRGYFGDMVRVDVTKMCKFCNKTHEDTICGNFHLVSETSSKWQKGTFDIEDIVSRVVVGSRAMPKLEQVPEEQGKPSLSFENSLVSKASTSAELEEEHWEDAVAVQQSALEPLSQGWSSSPTLHTSDYTNIEVIADEQLDSSLSGDHETNVAAVSDRLIAGGEDDLAEGMPFDSEDVLVVEGTGERSDWRQEMSLLD